MLRWFDGFDHYGVLARMIEGIGGGAAWSEIDSSWALSTANPATGTYHMRMTDSTVGEKIFRRIFGVASQVTGFGYRFSVAALPFQENGGGSGGALTLASIRDVANATHFVIVLGTDGSIIARRGSVEGAQIGRSDPCVAAGGYHHFELKSKIDNTTGFIEVRINEVTVLNLTGVDTQNTGNATAAQVAVIKEGNETAGFGTFDMDDAFAWDDDASDPQNTVVDWIGDKGVYRLAPIADTATSQFDLNGSATAYGALDEVPPNGTDYLDTASATARTIVEVEALPGNVSEIIALTPYLYTRKEDSGSVTMRGGLVVNGDESYGPDDSPSTAYAYLRPGPKTINPDTGVAWANSDLPDLLIERTA